MPRISKRHCPKCGSPMEYIPGRGYRCPNQGCIIHRVKFDRQGMAINLKIAAEPIEEYKVTHSIRGPAQ